MLQKQKVDFLWTDSGDLFIDETSKDLSDTKAIPYGALIQQVQDMIQSSSGDWLLNQEVGCNLSMFAGRPNTEENGLAIKRQVTELILRRGILSASELSVEVFPLSATQIGIVLFVRPTGSNNSSRLVYTYNMIENKLTVRRP